MSICPFISGIYQGRRDKLIACQDECKLKIGDDCAFKIIADKMSKAVRDSGTLKPDDTLHKDLT